MKDLILKLVLSVVPMILSALKKYITNEKFIELVDKLFDIVERWIEKEPNWYDPFLLEIIGVIRAAIGVPDLPDEPVNG